MHYLILVQKVTILQSEQHSFGMILYIHNNNQDVTHRSESIIGNLIDKSILLDFTR